MWMLSSSIWLFGDFFFPPLVLEIHSSGYGCPTVWLLCVVFRESVPFIYVVRFMCIELYHYVMSLFILAQFAVVSPGSLLIYVFPVLFFLVLLEIYQSYWYFQKFFSLTFLYYFPVLKSIDLCFYPYYFLLLLLLFITLYFALFVSWG